MRRKKGSATKTSVLCPNTTKLGVMDVMDQKTAAYRVGGRTMYHFYLRMLFDLIDVEDTAIVKDCSPPVGQVTKNLMNDPCPEKSQHSCSSSKRIE